MVHNGFPPGLVKNAKHENKATLEEGKVCVCGGGGGYTLTQLSHVPKELTVYNSGAEPAFVFIAMSSMHDLCSPLRRMPIVPAGVTAPPATLPPTSKKEFSSGTSRLRWLCL